MKTPQKIKVAGTVYEKVPEKIRVDGKMYVLAKQINYEHMHKKCPTGTHWNSIHKKCMKIPPELLQGLKEAHKHSRKVMQLHKKLSPKIKQLQSKLSGAHDKAYWHLNKAHEELSNKGFGDHSMALVQKHEKRFDTHELGI